MTDFTALEREGLIAELRRLHAAMRSSKLHSAKPFMDLELTIPQLRVVFLLAESEPMSMSPLAQELGITVSGCTRLIDKLVRAGLVARSEDPSDRRAVFCALTDDGQALAERVRQSVPFERQEVLDRLTVEDLRVVVRGMDIVQRVMTEVQAEQAQGASDGTAVQV